ncbi:outer membrane beta-barrel protein [Alteromonadaceae bacterium 2753L.S.0a.02]|nr:outer membrane beta-barrel protein [Alteromonadaceae bacterium 2753L.S.0a.02]
MPDFSNITGAINAATEQLGFTHPDLKHLVEKPSRIKTSAASSFAMLSVFCLLANVSFAQGGGTIGDIGKEEKDDEQLIEPNKKVEPVKTARIDTEKFELGAFYGVMNVEDFNTNPVKGLSFSYHINQKFLAQLQYGSSRVSPASFEENTGFNFLADEDYDFTYVAVNAGYKLLDGRSFFGRKTKMDSAIYVIAGLEQVDFAANSSTGLGIGASYRIVVTDWMTMNLDFKDHAFNRDFIGDSKFTNNTELTVGINALF